MGAQELALRRPFASPEQDISARDPDAELVTRFRAGDRAAFEQLVRKYQKGIYFLIIRQVGDGDEAAELTQRAFIRALGGLSAFRGAAQFRTWLYRIAVNLALNHLRDHAKFARDQAPEEHAGTSASAVEQLVAAEDAGRLRAAVARLPHKQRLTLELRVYEDLSFREVAHILGTSEGAAKVNYHYAVKRLKQWLGEES